MEGLLLTQSSAPIVGQISWLLGHLMNGIFSVLSNVFHIENIGLCIIIFTIIIYTLLLPLTYKQQKASKLTVVMNPELRRIQNKYKNKKDQASMMKMQEERNFHDGRLFAAFDSAADSVGSVLCNP